MISRRFLVSLLSAASLVLGTSAFARGDALTAGRLPSWNDGAAKRSVVAFVEKVTRPGSPDFVPAAERIATFDNDGAPRSEQPVPVQLHFALDRVKALAPPSPGTGKLFAEKAYQPMVELLAYLKANGFRNFIVSGGGIEFMRPWTGKA